MAVSDTLGPSAPHARDGLTRRRSTLDAPLDIGNHQHIMTEIDFCAVAKEKQAKRQSLLPKEWLATEETIEKCKNAARGRPNWPLTLPDLVLQDEDRLITSSSAEEILSHLHTSDRAQRWTARKVTEAFCKRATLAHQLTNCLTEILFDEALRRADELDAFFDQNGRPAGPLAGLPVSIKDNFNIRGYDSTVGFVCWANDPQSNESLLTRILREQGAILYCKTNIPTAMMIAETVNNVWGRTLNPHNLDYTSGGSSGGEGALVAMRGSPLGVGTDIGGSIRIPGAMCGLYALKPSLGRFPTMGARSGMPGQESVSSINGPMAQDLSSLSIFASAISNWEPWRLDPKCVPMPWRPVDPSSLPPKGLVFGIILDDGYVRPTPPIARALTKVREALTAAGHTVLEWRVENNEFAQGARMLLDFFVADGRHGILELMKKGGEAEKWVPGLGKPLESKTIPETWAVQSERWAWGAHICEKWQSMTGPNGRVMDAIISPAAPHAGAPHTKFGPYVGYTGVWNIIDFPGLVLPVTQVDAKLDAKPTPLPTPHSDMDRDVWETYDAQTSHGLPANIQIVGRRLEEEKLLALAQRVDELLKIPRT